MNHVHLAVSYPLLANQSSPIVLKLSVNPLRTFRLLNRDYYYSRSGMYPSTFTLNTGAQIPSTGLGTWQAQPKELEEVPSPRRIHTQSILFLVFSLVCEQR